MRSDPAATRMEEEEEKGREKKSLVIRLYRIVLDFLFLTAALLLVEGGGRENDKYENHQKSRLLKGG